MNIKINPIQNLNFGYNSVLKKEWKAGNLGSVTKGLYGDTLTLKNLSIEHIQCKSDGGPSCLRNYALASKQKNWARGNKKLTDVLTVDMIKDYLKQFINIKTKKFDGNKYINMVIPTFEKLGFVFYS